MVPGTNGWTNLVTFIMKPVPWFDT
jgi:hypothetical protein